jgi:hypothetical protein
MLSPRDEWQRIADEGWPAAIAYAAMLSLIPAAASLVMKQSSPLPLPEHTVAATYAAFLFGIVFVAAAFRVLAFFFREKASWSACLRVAAYGATPVLIAALFLVTPALVFVPVLAMVYVFYLYYLGAQRLLAIAEDESAIFVAISLVAAFVASTLCGAAAGAVGLL